MPDRPGTRRGRRRHWRRLVPCWWSAVVLVTGGGIAAAQPPDDPLPDEIGPGWEVATADFCQFAPPWVVRCFSGPSGVVLVAAAPVVMDARFEAQFFASGFNAAAEPSPDARGCLVAAARGVRRLALLRHRQRAVRLPGHPLSARSTNRVRRCPPPRRCAGSPGPRRRPSRVPGGARRASRDCGGPGGGPAGRLPCLAPARIVEDADRYDVPMSDRLRELFERESRSVVRTFTNGAVIVVVWLSVQPYEHLSAAELGTVEGSEVADPATLAGVDRIEDAVAFRVEPATIGAAFRQRRPLRDAPEHAIGPVAEAAAADALIDLATRQAALLPDGDSDPYFFPSRTAAVVTAVGVTTGVCLVIAGTGWIAVLRSRRRRPTHGRAGARSRRRLAGSIPPSLGERGAHRGPDRRRERRGRRPAFRDRRRRAVECGHRRRWRRARCVLHVVAGCAPSCDRWATATPRAHVLAVSGGARRHRAGGRCLPRRGYGDGRQRPRESRLRAHVAPPRTVGCSSGSAPRRSAPLSPSAASCSSCSAACCCAAPAGTCGPRRHTSALPTGGRRCSTCARSRTMTTCGWRRHDPSPTVPRAAPAAGQ